MGISPPLYLCLAPLLIYCQVDLVHLTLFRPILPVLETWQFRGPARDKDRPGYNPEGGEQLNLSWNSSGIARR